MARRKPRKKAGAQSLTHRPYHDSTAHLPGWLTHRRMQMWLFLLLGMALYANTLTHQYTLDDAIVLSENVFTQKGIEGIPGIFQHDTFYGFFQQEGKDRLVSGGRYRPLTPALLALEVELFGLDPLVGHLFNAFYYGLTCLVLYLVLWRLLRNHADPAFPFFTALAATLVFTVHPVHTEAVANIKGRDEIWSLLLSLGALGFSLRAHQDRQPWWQLAVLVLFFLALTAKENAITFLAVAPLAFYFFERISFGKILWQMAPFLAAAAGFLLLRGMVVGWEFGEPSGELMNNPFLKVVGDRYLPFTPAEKAATILFTLGKYVQLLFIPHPLTHDYYPRHIGVMDWGDWRVWFYAAVYLGLVLYALLRLPKKDPLSFGILYFLATISIVSNIVFPVGTHMSERFLFMPSVGYALAVGVLLYRLAIFLGRADRVQRRRQLWLPLLLLLGIGVLYGGKTVDRNRVWKDNFTLFSTDIEVSSNSAKLRNALGGELVTRAGNMEEGSPRREDMLREAIGHLQRAVQIHPNYKNAHLLMGNAYYYLKNFDLSIQQYQRTLQLDNDYEDARNNLFITYRDAGRYFGEQKGDLARAIQYLEQAYQMRPNDFETVRLLGVAHGRAGHNQEAIRFFTRATEIQPDNAEAWFNLGSAYYNAGNPDKGAELHEKARQLDPNVGSRQ